MQFILNRTSFDCYSVGIPRDTPDFRVDIRKFTDKRFLIHPLTFAKLKGKNAPNYGQFIVERCLLRRFQELCRLRKSNIEKKAKL